MISTLEVVGLKEALREINEINPKLRRDITKDFKKILQPVVTDVKGRVPKQPPLSGWGRTWKTPSGFQMLPWDSTLANKYVDAKVSGKKPKEFAGIVRDLAVLVIRWRGAVNTMWDLSADGQTPQGDTMIRALNSRYGTASRAMWPAWENRGDQVEKEIEDTVVRVMAYVNRRINRDMI